MFKHPELYTRKLLGHVGKFPKLQNVPKTGIVLRFAPEPSGYLHIGHVKALVINDHYYQHAKNAKIILRFDNTNTTKAQVKYEQIILQDLQTLEFKFDQITHTSDYMLRILMDCKRLIENGDAYVDLCDQKDIAHQRANLVESPYRNSSIEENLDLWAKMCEKNADVCAIVRSKINAQHSNAALRDPALVRMLNGRVAPMYDLACPIVDHLEGVTHAFRDRQYHDRKDLYKWVLKKLGYPPVQICEFSRLNFVGTCTSKRIMRQIIDSPNNSILNWNDPILPTVCGITRRGIHPHVLRSFIWSFGTSFANCLVSFSKLEALNKKFWDSRIPRYFCIYMSQVAKYNLESDEIELPFQKEIQLHPKKPEMGKRIVEIGTKLLFDKRDLEFIKNQNNFENNVEITCVNFGNVVLNLQNETAVTNIDGDFRKTKHKLHWLNGKNLYTAKKIFVHKYNRLLKVDKLPKNVKNVLDYLSEPCVETQEITCESAISTINVGDVIQFQRVGYFRCDQITEKEIHFIELHIA